LKEIKIWELEAASYMHTCTYTHTHTHTQLWPLFCSFWVTDPSEWEKYVKGVQYTDK